MAREAATVAEMVAEERAEVVRALETVHLLVGKVAHEDSVVVAMAEVARVAAMVGVSEEGSEWVATAEEVTAAAVKEVGMGVAQEAVTVAEVTAAAVKEVGMGVEEMVGAARAEAATVAARAAEREAVTVGEVMVGLVREPSQADKAVEWEVETEEG